MNTAKTATVVAVFAILFGLAGFALAGYCVLQNRETATQLLATQDAVQTLSANNQDLSDRLQKNEPAGRGMPAGGRGAAGKIDPDLANEIRSIEARLNDLDGGQAGLGIKSDLSQLKMDVSRLDSKVEDLARRR